MLFLKLVIAHLVGVKTRFTDKLVRLMQTVGLVRQAHILPHGNNLSVQDTKLQPQPAQSKLKRNSKVVPQTTQVTSLKPIQKPVRIKLGQDGSQRIILVPSTPQPAKVAPTKKRKVADSTTQAKKSTKSKTSAKTPTVRQRKVRGT